ncbi:hypothetical protein [Mangrovimonas sp. DI 80]|uniref:hypothetical protein n=1 Tax=Mangrovimonas sp. DI 80 TaxID=1779330 RepID=UPI000F503505|nr:hypothetical protein [Mangrovimonas sp. DI 80]
MRLFFLIFCFVFFYSCKSEKKETKAIEAPNNSFVINDEVEGNLYFEIILEVLVTKDDKFHLFYKDLNDTEYSSERVVERIVKGSENLQTIVFSIPEEVIPNGLRLDVGVNFSQEPIFLKNLKIRYDKKEFYFNDGKFEQLFRPNKFISYDSLDQIIFTQSIDGIYDPNFVSINLEDIVFSMID